MDVLRAERSVACACFFFTRKTLLSQRFFCFATDKPIAVLSSGQAMAGKN